MLKRDSKYYEILVKSKGVEYADKQWAKRDNKFIITKKDSLKIIKWANKILNEPRTSKTT